MIEMQSLKSQPGVEPGTPAVEPEVPAGNRVTPLEGFLRFVVIAAGIVLGAILALIIGLFTGWVPFSC